MVLLHGLSRTSRAMEPLAQYLYQAGYRVVNIDYPSRDLPVEALAGELRAELASYCAQARQVDFLGALGARLLLGPAGAELGTDPDSVPGRLPARRDRREPHHQPPLLGGDARPG